MGGTFERIVKGNTLFKKLNNITRDLVDNQLLFVTVCF